MVNVVFVDKNSTTGETTGDNVSFYGRVKPSRNASTDKVEARVLNGLESAFACRVNVVTIFPDVREEGDKSFVEVGATDKGVELVSESADLTVFIVLSSAVVLDNALVRHEVNESFTRGRGRCDVNFAGFSDKSFANVNCGGLARSCLTYDDNVELWVDGVVTLREEYLSTEEARDCVESTPEVVVLMRFSVSPVCVVCLEEVHRGSSGWRMCLQSDSPPVALGFVA